MEKPYLLRLLPFAFFMFLFLQNSVFCPISGSLLTIRSHNISHKISRCPCDYAQIDTMCLCFYCRQLNACVVSINAGKRQKIWCLLVSRMLKCWNVVISKRRTFSVSLDVFCAELLAPTTKTAITYPAETITEIYLKSYSQTRTCCGNRPGTSNTVA